jgi:hypothetical protein
MKNPLKPLLSTIAFCAFLTVGTSHVALSQKVAAPEIASFLILIETTNDGFKMFCKEGCAWKELRFDLKPYKPQAIDQFGITSLEKHEQQPKDANLASFLFTVKKVKKNGVDLQATEGTAWTQLGFRGPGIESQQYIDAYGTAKPKG